MSKYPTTQEVWLPIQGFEGWFEVSNLGRVRSLERVLSTGRRWKGRLMNLKAGPSGHLSVRLCRNGEQSWRWAHRLVLQAFVGPCPDGMEACHNDGDPEHNVVENLRWDTRKGNHADKLRHGTMAHGARNGNAKLTEPQVLRAFAMYAEGKTKRAIATALGVTPANISCILLGRTWKHARPAA